MTTVLLIVHALVAVALSLSPQRGGTASLITGAAFALIAAMVSGSKYTSWR